MAYIDGKKTHSPTKRRSCQLIRVTIEICVFLECQEIISGAGFRNFKHYVPISVNLVFNGKRSETSSPIDAGNTFDIIYIAKEELYDNQKQKIQRAIDQYLEPNLSLNFIKTQDIKRSKSGKLKQFMSEVSH